MTVAAPPAWDDPRYTREHAVSDSPPRLGYPPIGDYAPRARATRFAAQKADLAAFLDTRLAELVDTGFGPIDRAAAVALAAILRPHRPGRVEGRGGGGDIWVRYAGCEWAAYPCENVRTALKIWDGHPDFLRRWLRLRTDK